MKTYSAPVLAAFASGKLALTQFVHVVTYSPFPDIYINTSGWDLDFAGHTWAGSAGLVQINAISTEYGELPSVEFMLSAQPSAISLALVDAQNMRGKHCEIRTAVLSVGDDGTVTLLDAPIEWAGIVDTFGVNLDKRSALVSVTCETAALDLMRPSNFRYTTDDQKTAYPTDKGFEFVKDSDSTVVWPAASWGKV